MIKNQPPQQYIHFTLLIMQNPPLPNLTQVQLQNHPMANNTHFI